MTLEKLIMMGLVKDHTKLIIQDGNFNTLAIGKWFEDHILHYIESDVVYFDWDKENVMYIDVEIN